MEGVSVRKLNLMLLKIYWNCLIFKDLVKFESSVKTPEPKNSSVKAPEHKSSNVKAPEHKNSSVKAPEHKSSSVKAPEPQNSSVKAPELCFKSKIALHLK